MSVFVTHLCPSLCDHMDCSSPGSSVHGILQARILEWGAIRRHKEIIPGKKKYEQKSVSKCKHNVFL